MKSIRKGYLRPLITHSIRKFPTIGGAYHHALRLTAANKQCRFALEQTQSGHGRLRVLFREVQHEQHSNYDHSRRAGRQCR